MFDIWLIGGIVVAVMAAGITVASFLFAKDFRKFSDSVLLKRHPTYYCPTCKRYFQSVEHISSHK
jgi:hypothetical protein